jgi:hypothetical protein
MYKVEAHYFIVNLPKLTFCYIILCLFEIIYINNILKLIKLAIELSSLELDKVSRFKISWFRIRDV